jgi:hypothetical protein
MKQSIDGTYGREYNKAIMKWGSVNNDFQ